MKNSEKTLDMIVNLCKNRGFIYPGSEIYGGLANSWDYGPLGVEFKNNVKKAWMKKFVQESPYNVGLDAAILMNPQTWVTTGHVSSFSDPLLDCRACKSRHRADKLISECEQGKGVDVDAMTFDEMDEFIATHPEVVCPVCGKHDFTPIRKFNLMFKTAIGVTEDSSSTCYLRPETAQGIFVNFANIQRTTRRKLPFGVCQVGKASVSYTHLDVYKRQALTLAQALTDDVLCGLGSNAAKLLGLEGRDHALADLVALADLLGILQADLGVGILDLLHDVTQQAGTERAKLGVNVHNDIVVLDLVVLLDRNDDGRLDLVDQVVLGQAALLFQCRKGLKKFVVRSSHVSGFLPIIFQVHAIQ